MTRVIRNVVTALIALILVSGIGFAVYRQLMQPAAETRGGGDRGPVPVEVAEVRLGPIELRRVFSGTLESPSVFDVAPKVSGRIERLFVDVADRVERGQVIAELDNDEYQQAVAQAEAEMAVAQANLNEAESALEITRRELARVRTLHERGVSSESQLDAITAEQLARQAAVEVAKAQLMRAQAALETNRIRLGYTRVTATWTGEDSERVVAERFVDEGDTVAANARMLSITELSPILGVVHVTERDYGLLQPGQQVTVRTDAYPGRSFAGHVTRVSPIFRRTSRQARVEFEILNEDHALKPGMFIRAETILDRREQATVIPLDALTRREGGDVVFVLSEDGTSVVMKSVQVGIRQGEHVEVIDGDIAGRVVTLGQQLLNDGSRIIIPQRRDASVTKQEPMSR